MRKLLVLLIVIVIVFSGLLFGHSLIGQKGYVLISFGQTIVEMSVLSALLSLLMILVAVRILEWLFKSLLSAVLGSKRWFGMLSSRKQKKAMFNSINLLATGEVVLAKKSIERTFSGDFGGSNYILAANIDKQLNNTNSMVRNLEVAQTFPESKNTATMQLASWHLSQQQFSQGLDLLESLPSNTPKTAQLGKLWLEALAGSSQWDRFKEVLGHYKKVLGTEYIVWAQRATQDEFAEIASKQGAIGLQERWQNLSRTARKDIANQVVYIRLLIEQGMSKEAEAHLVSFAGKQANEHYLDLFKLISHANPTQSLALIESWIKNDPENSELYSTLANVAANSHNYELAEKAVCKALELGNNHSDAKLYAGLLERKKDFEKAALVYKKVI